MRVAPALFTLLVLAASPLDAQAAGDSIRLRVFPSRTWTHGRIVSLDGGQLTLSQEQSTQSFQLATISRLEIRTRKKPAVTLLEDAFAATLGAGLAILTRPANRRSIFGSDTKALAVSAGLGLGIGLIELSVAPWRWKRVRVGVAAP
jgi:hypothetical protein